MNRIISIVAFALTVTWGRWLCACEPCERTSTDDEQIKAATIVVVAKRDPAGNRRSSPHEDYRVVVIRMLKGDVQSDKLHIKYERTMCDSLESVKGDAIAVLLQPSGKGTFRLPMLSC